MQVKTANLGYNPKTDSFSKSEVAFWGPCISKDNFHMRFMTGLTGLHCRVDKYRDTNTCCNSIPKRAYRGGSRTGALGLPRSMPMMAIMARRPLASSAFSFLVLPKTKQKKGIMWCWHSVAVLHLHMARNLTKSCLRAGSWMEAPKPRYPSPRLPLP